MANLFVFGDSIAQGAWDEEGGWADRLKSHIYSLRVQKDLRDLPTLYNLGIDGDTTGEVLGRLSNEITARAKYTNEPHIILNIGANDTLWLKDENRLATAPEEFRETYRQLLRQAKTYGGQVFCLGIIDVDESRVQPLPWEPNESYSNKHLAEYDEIVRAVTAEENVTYIDVSGLVDQTKTLDGVHPDSGGHRNIFEVVRQSLEEAGLLPTQN